MEPNHEPSEYRSAKSASRKIAAELAAISQLPDSDLVEQASPYNPARHEQYPRLIETKPERFAIEAHLIAQVADIALIGEGDESRLPALIERRESKHPFFKPEEQLERLMEDWYDADFSEEVKLVLDQPQEQAVLQRYDAIVKEIFNDLHANPKSFLSGENGREEVSNRIDPANSIELAWGGYFLIKWSDQLLADAGINHTPDQRRNFLLQNLDFIDQIAQLELRHADQYFGKKWRDNLVVTAEEAGVKLATDVDGALRIRLKEKERPPGITMGPTVGCPAGFNLNPAGSAIRRLGTAYINEAFDRGLL
jgi:hypothetical protein